MIIKAKYIRTEDNSIIVFSPVFDHSDFKIFKPASAGLIKIYSEGGNTKCSCYGSSFTLGLSSDEEIDTIIAQSQIIGHNF